MKKFENYLIASDIDGTLLWESSYVNPRNLEKLRHFCENGGHFALSTGRNHLDIHLLLKEFSEYITMPCILCNGSYLYDVHEKKMMNPRHFDRKRAGEFFCEVHRTFPNIGFRASFPNGFLVPKDDTIIMPIMRIMKIEQFATFCDIEDFGKHDLFKSVFVSDDKSLEDLRALIREKYSDVFSVTTSGPSMLELMPLGVSKGYQMPYLKGLYPGAQLWCIGDYENDIEMLRAADVAVCPENAVDSVKEIAHIKVCHCKEGALAELIDEIERRIDLK